MEIIVLLALITSTLITIMACFARSTKRTIHFLVLQATAIGFVELMYCLINLILGLQFEALIDFFATFAEWFSCAIVSPLIIYWGMMKTQNNVDQPVIGTRNATVLVIAMTLAYLTLGTWLLFLLPPKFEAFPFTAFMLSLSVFFMTTRKDSLKILVGLNMAENALYPLIAESPLGLIPLMLLLMIFVNVVGVFVIREAYREYGTLSVTKWRWTG